MVSRWKKIIIGIVIVCPMAFAAVFAAISLYPNAQICFDGIQLVSNNGTQGFVDITLKNINTTGVSFCLEYNQNYLELSDAYTNEPIKPDVPDDDPNLPEGVKNLNISHKYFKQNTSIFPEDTFQDETETALSTPSVIANMPIIGISDQDSAKDKCHLKMHFIPKDGAEESCDYIKLEDDDDHSKIMANSDTGLKLGAISFRIKDPAEFSKLSSDDLKKIIKIVPFSSMTDLKNNPDEEDPTEDENQDLKDTGVHISYMNSEGHLKYYSSSERYINYEFNITVKLEDVKPQTQEITVTSYELYKNNELQDLFDLLNERASDVTLVYADGTQDVVEFVWDKEKSEIAGSIYDPWDPTGYDRLSSPEASEEKAGKQFIVTQTYNDDFSVKVTVNIKPISLIGFDFDNDDITYLYGSEDFPTNFEALTLPNKARAVLDTYISNGGVGDIPISWYSLGQQDDSSGLWSDPLVEIDALPAGFDSEEAHRYLFYGHVDGDIATQKISYDCPWLITDVYYPEIKVWRNVVVNPEDMPQGLVVESSETDENGVLTIFVKNKDDTHPIPEGTVFDIKMPGGERIDSDAMEDRYSVTIEDGKAKIVLAPNITNKKEQKLAQTINLGSRAGKFSIASTEPDKHRGPYTAFETDPRKNIYLKAADGKDYEFDYSSANAAMFPVKAGTELPTTIRLPRKEDFIKTTYSGIDGTLEGSLETFTVDRWNPISGDPNKVGDVVILKGRLADTSYTNYGAVANDNDVFVTIKYLVLEDDGAEEIEVEFINGTNYDPRQEGYGYDLLQTKTFKIKNKGSTAIHGLSASISLSKDSSKEAFEITKKIPQILDGNKSADLDITTLIGLPVLDDAEYTDYVCTVSVSSTNSASLKSFEISFKVTKAPVYHIKINVPEEQKNFGKAETENGHYSAVAGESITVIATPEEDCAFEGWTVADDAITLADSEKTQPRLSFQMPQQDVVMKASFKETLGAKLRATELELKNTSNEDQKLYDEKWNEIQFDPVKREYYAVVANDTDKVKLWFKLREEAEGATLALTCTRGSNPAEELPSPDKDEEDGYFKTQEIDVELSPTDNLVELKITQKDPDAPSTEAEETRSYKIHVYRKLKNSELATFKYGNSPFGLIMRDSSLTSEQKDAYKEAFISNNYTFVEGSTPKDGTPNIKYTNQAWGSVNYDLDSSALFVIKTEPFVDPGCEGIKNSLGDDVKLDTVSKKIEIKVLVESESEEERYGSPEDFLIAQSETIDLPASGSIEVLKNKRIRPDCYELIYSFTDFDGTPISVSKPLIILNPLGDVTVNGTVDDKDVSRVLNRFKQNFDLANEHNTKDFSEPYNGGALFKYRVCDANNDGNLNAIDANKIRTRRITPFYQNLLEGGGGP